MSLQKIILYAATVSLIGGVFPGLISCNSSDAPISPEFFKVEMSMLAQPTVGNSVMLSLNFQPRFDSADTNAKFFVSQSIQIESLDDDRCRVGLGAVSNSQQVTVRLPVEIVEAGQWKIEARLSGEHSDGSTLDESHFLCGHSDNSSGETVPCSSLPSGANGHTQTPSSEISDSDLKICPGRSD